MLDTVTLATTMMIPWVFKDLFLKCPVHLTMTRGWLVEVEFLDQVVWTNLTVNAVNFKRVSCLHHQAGW
ncbi:unnamed protein product [Trichobilharzia regenti]|nr:unnamed protein product [Trichobilharzia regenti]